MFGHQCHGLGVGLGFKSDPVFGQFGAQFAVVFDDAVMHNGDRAGLVRVGVVDRWRTMGGPASVANPGFARQRVMDQQVTQVDQLAYRPATPQRPVIHSGNAGAIISAIFQPFQRFNQNRGDLMLPQNTYNSTHKLRPLYRGEPFSPLTYQKIYAHSRVCFPAWPAQRPRHQLQHLWSPPYRSPSSPRRPR